MGKSFTLLPHSCRHDYVHHSRMCTMRESWPDDWHSQVWWNQWARWKESSWEETNEEEHTWKEGKRSEWEESIQETGEEKGRIIRSMFLEWNRFLWMRKYKLLLIIDHSRIVLKFVCYHICDVSTSMNTCIHYWHYLHERGVLGKN